MSKSRILILTGIFPPDIGGPATQLDALIRELIKNNYQVRVLTFGQTDGQDYPYPVKKISQQWPYPLKTLLYIFNGLILSLKTDVLYNQDLYTAGLTSLIIKKILRKPLVTRFVEDSVWETVSSERKYSWKTELGKKVRKKILTNSDRIIVVSYFLEDLAQKIGLPKEKIKVIYNSIDFLKERPSLTNKEELKGKIGFKGITLLTIARLTPWKGIDMLIEIMPDLVRKYGQINLVIAGQGGELNNLQQISQSLNLQDFVFFRGKLNRQQVVDYLGAADLFLLNSHHEGMSFTLLEAMKIGLPIITTKKGGNLETIKDGQTGLLVDYKNKEQWLEAISLILDNPALAEKLIKQAKDDLKRFSWSNLVDQTVSVFRSL